MEKHILKNLKLKQTIKSEKNILHVFDIIQHTDCKIRIQQI